MRYIVADCVGLCSFETKATEYCWGMENSTNDDFLVVLWLGHPLFFFRLLSNAFSDFGSVGRSEKEKKKQ